VRPLRFIERTGIAVQPVMTDNGSVYERSRFHAV
jgi:hypothetical protein